MKIRAKMNLQSVEDCQNYENWKFSAVYGGSSNAEDNTYASATPCGKIELQVTNKALLGKLKAGKQYYVDFTEIEEAPKA